MITECGLGNKLKASYANLSPNYYHPWS